jgi:hypothetical protein
VNVASLPPLRLAAQSAPGKPGCGERIVALRLGIENLTRVSPDLGAKPYSG